MKDDKLVLLLLLLGVAAYLLMKNRQQAHDNGTLYGGSPDITRRASTAGGATGVGTNPLTLAFQGLERGLTSLLGGSRPGGAPANAIQPASPPMAGPTIYAGSLPPSPPLMPYPTGMAVPNIADPNLGYLNSLIDINQLMTPGVQIPDVSGANQAGDLNVSPDFDWQYSPTSPGIAVVGLE